MSEEFEPVDPSDLKENDDELDNSDAIDAEFSEFVAPPPAVPIVKDDDAQPVFVAEPVIEPAQESQLDLFFKDLPQQSGSVTIVVTRKPDPKNTSFRIPCRAEMHIGNMIWSGESPAEIHDQIRDADGGGHYHCQLRYGKGFSDRTWSILIADPSGPSEREKNMQEAVAKTSEHERIAEPTPVFAPQPTPAAGEDELLEKAFDKLERMQKFFDRFKPEPLPPAPLPDAVPIKDQIALAMMKHVGESTDPDLPVQVVKKILGLADPKEEKAWSDVAWHGITHAEQIGQMIGTVAGVAGPLIARLFGRQDPAPPKTAMLPVRNSIVMPTAVAQPVAPSQGIVMPDEAPQSEPGAAEAPQPAVTSTQAVRW